MSWWRRIARSLVGDGSMNQRIDDEMAFHLEVRVNENIAKGMTPEAAARAARASFGHRGVQAEATRDVRVVPWLEPLGRDVRFGVRSLWRRPGLWMTAVLSLALGVGATATVFSLLDAVAFKPLPFPVLDRLFVVAERKEGEAVGGNPLRLRDYAGQVGSFAAVAGYFGESSIVTGRGDPERLEVRRTFGSYFEIFGPTPMTGRVFSPEEQAGQPVIAVRERVAAKWFGSAAVAVGQSVTVDGTAHTIVGIVPNGGHPLEIEAWAPAPAGLQAGPRRGSYLFTVAKLGAWGHRRQGIGRTCHGPQTVGPGVSGDRRRSRCQAGATAGGTSR